MKILVTGGAGFIGANFIHYVLGKYRDVTVVNYDKLTYAGNLDNLKGVEKDARYKFVKGDICDEKFVDKIVSGGIDRIVNFAAESHVDRSITDPGAFVRTNVYGAHVLLEAAKKHKVERFLHISCYDSKTRAFTREGLKTYNEIKEGELVLTINVENRKVEWKPVEKIIVQDYAGKMIRMKTDTVDMLVTPNHRMLVQMLKSKKLAYKTAEDVANEAVNKLPKHYQWEGEMPDILKNQKFAEQFMYLLGIFIGDGFVAYQEKNIPSKTGLTREEFLKNARDRCGRFKLVGMHGKQKFNVSKSWRIFLDIPENDSCRKRCEKSLDALGVRWHKQKGKSGEHIYFTSKELFHIFEQCGKNAKNKEIPLWALESSPTLLRPLLDGLLDSDGSRGYCFFTSSLKLARQVMVLCVKLGFNPILKSRFSRSKIDNRDVSGLSYCILISKKEWRGVRREIISEVDYRGKIWCLKIKNNKNFLVERNGKATFCGNTDEVYGSREKGSFKESDAFSPSSPYSASKAGADLLALAYHKTFGLPVVVTRSSNNFGPYQYPEKLIPRFITNAMRDAPLPLYGDGLAVRDWLYVGDNCEALDLVLEKGKPGEAYNIGAGNEHSNREITDTILEALKKPESLIKYVADRPGHDRRYSISTEKVAALGWKPKHEFRAAMLKTVKWYVQNEWWWKKLI